MFYDENSGQYYENLEEYYNSPVLDDDLIYNYLAQGKRTPQNMKEVRWQKEGQELLKKGGYDISFD